MRFSIIIPAYNVGNFVSQAIDSCLKQRKFEDFEIIVINDGSTDCTWNILQRYKDNPKVNIIHQQNMGLSMARNVGMNHASGEYLVFLDGDDWLAEDALSILDKHVRADSLLVFPLTYYYSENNITKDNYNLSNGSYTSDYFIHQTIGNGKFNIIPAQSKVYPARILRENDLQFIPNILHEDNPFFIKTLALVHNIKFIDENIYYYRQNRDGAITSSYRLKNFKDILVGIEKIKDIHSFENSDVNYLIGSLHTFQIIMEYSDGKKDQARKHYRRWQSKKELFQLFNKIHSHTKLKFKLLLLMLDPFLLEVATKYAHENK